MTAALGCFDMERHEQDLAVTFSITFQFRNRNSPFAAFLCNPPASHHPVQASQHSFLHFLSLLAFVHSGPLHRGLYTRLAASSCNPCFPLMQACFFFFLSHFIWDAKSSLTEIGGGWEGNQGWGKFCKRVQIRSSVFSALVQLRKASVAVFFMFYVSGRVIFQSSKFWKRDRVCIWLNSIIHHNCTQLHSHTQNRLKCAHTHKHFPFYLIIADEVVFIFTESFPQGVFTVWSPTNSSVSSFCLSSILFFNN